jgi:hypothetical protein
MRPHAPWIVLVLALAGILLWRESQDGWPREVDRAFASWLAREVAPPSQPAAVTVVTAFTAADAPSGPGSSEAAVKTPFGQPMDYALFLKSILPSDPSVAVIEPILAWKDPAPAYLSALEDYARRAPKLILGTALGRTSDPDEDNPRLPVVGVVRGDVSRVPEFSAVELRPAGELRDLGTAGVTSLPDPVSAARGWIPMVVRYRGDIVPTLPLLASIYRARTTVREVSVEPGREIRIGDNLRIPIDRTGAALIAPAAIAGLRRAGYADLLVGAETGANTASASGDVVMLTAGGPDADRLATAIVAIQTGGVLSELRSPWSLAPALALALCGALLFLLPRPSALLAAIGIGAGYAMVARSLAGAHALALPVVVPAGVLLVLLLLRLALGSKPPRPEPASPAQG